MRVIGAAGKSGRHLLPLINMGGGDGGQVMLVAGREKVHFHGCQIGSIDHTCLASGIGQSQFRIGRDMWAVGRHNFNASCKSVLFNCLHAAPTYVRF